MKRLLDLFCKAGGAAAGYYRAGFEIVGVDIEPQPRYPFAFVRMDAIEAMRLLLDGGYITDNHKHRWYLSDFDAIHASPPCQGYSVTEPMKRKERKQKEYPKLIVPVRELLRLAKKPYIIENVKGAPLVNPIRLKGGMFGLNVIRERLFETNPQIWLLPCPAKQIGRTAKRGEYERGQYGLVCVAGNNFEPSVARQAMGIDWMIRDELAEAIPPAYTEWIGQRIIELAHL
jgi:DNA (cytosine-5)-methyltransferase 1